MKRRRVYVTMNVQVSPDGIVRPRSMIWEDGEEYEVDRVKRIVTTDEGTRYTLMTDGKELSSQTVAQIKKLAPSKVVICGGTVAVSDDVKRQISSIAGKSLSPLSAILYILAVSLAGYRRFSMASATFAAIINSG